MTTDTVLTDRLILRRWADPDIAQLASFNADPEVMRWTETGEVLSLEETRADVELYEQRWEERGFGLFAVESRATGRLAGFAGLSVPQFLPHLLPAVAVGCRLGRPYWGRGQATEALNASLWFGFERLGLDRIVSTHQATNEQADRCAMKMGMTRIEELACPHCDRPMYVYEIARSQFGWSGAKVA